MKITIAILAAAIGAFVAGRIHAATLPAGTTVIVKTTDTIASNANPGSHFGAVVAHGSAGFPADATFTGKVVTSKRMQSSKERLTVDLVEVTVGGKKHHLKTTGPISLESYTSSRGTSFSPGFYHV